MTVCEGVADVSRVRMKVVCPYCGFGNSFALPGGMHIVGCDCDEGGCDRRFVLDVPNVAPVQVRLLEIEGQGPQL